MLHYSCPSCGGELTSSPLGEEMICTTCGTKCNCPQPIYADQPGTCINCGAKITEMHNILSGFCDSCESSFIDTDVLNSMYQINYIIPFSIEIDEAKRRMKKWVAERPLLPRRFVKEFSPRKNNRIYLPFWCFDIHNKIDTVYDATKTKSYTSGGYRITEISHYDVHVRGDSKYNCVPVTGMANFNSKYLESVSQYNNNNLIEFDTRVLSNSFSKKYDVGYETTQPMAIDTCKKFDISYIEESVVTGKDIVSTKDDNTIHEIQKINLIYYPLYVFECEYKDKIHRFFLNGQTGEISGDSPISLSMVFKLILKYIGVLIYAFLVLRFVLHSYKNSVSMILIILEALILIGVPIGIFILKRRK